MTQRTAWIAGASGLVGSHCLRLLLARPEYERVVSLVRRPSGLSDPKLQEIVVDFGNLAKLQAPAPDDVFCSLGTTIKKAGSKEAFRKVDAGYVEALAARAAASGAKRFLFVSSVATDPRSPNFYLRVKAEAEAAIAAQPLEMAGMLRPSFLMGDRSESRLGERIAIPLARTFAFLLFGPMRIYRAIDAEIVAEAMLGAALHAGPGRHIWHYDAIEDWAKKLTSL
ncbi:MAG: NAD(P)H-binding protein [Acidobacteria bacterium]|nr:NAD(P)H-binding protein [Acidobacteriota bacterium]